MTECLPAPRVLAPFLFILRSPERTMPFAYAQSTFIHSIERTERRLIVRGHTTGRNNAVRLDLNGELSEGSELPPTYTLRATQGIPIDVLQSFQVSASCPPRERAPGLCIHVAQQPHPKTILFLPVQATAQFTATQNNRLTIQAAHYSRSRKQLIIEARHTGGGFPHQFRLEYDRDALKAGARELQLNLVDTSPRDPSGEALPIQLRFDLRALPLPKGMHWTARLSTPSGGPEVVVEASPEPRHQMA